MLKPDLELKKQIETWKTDQVEVLVVMVLVMLVLVQVLVLVLHC